VQRIFKYADVQNTSHTTRQRNGHFDTLYTFLCHHIQELQTTKNSQDFLAHLVDSMYQNGFVLKQRRKQDALHIHATTTAVNRSHFQQFLSRK